MNKLKSYGYYFTDSISRFVKYLADALGITPDEPPIIKELSEIVRAIKADTGITFWSKEEARKTPAALTPSSHLRAAKWASYVAAEADALNEIQDDWDGEGAQAPRYRVVQECFDTLIHLFNTAIDIPFPAIAPHPQGGVVVIWDEGDKSVEIEFLPGIDPEVYVLNPDLGEPITGDIDDLEMELVETVSQMRVQETNPYR